MTPVWHDGASILVNGSEPYPSRSLYAESRGEMIWSIAHNGFVVARLPWGQYARQDGSGFASQAEALAYLQGEYSKSPMFSIGNVSGLQAVLEGRALVVHTHVIADVTGLQAALDGKQPTGSYAPLNHTHGITDVTGLQFALDGKAAASHSHTVAQVTGLQTALDGKQVAGSYAAASHTHVIADITGLQSALDGKAALNHTHTIAQVTGLQSALDAKLTATFAAAVTTRALNTTFQPNANKAVLVSYTVKTQVTNPLLVGASTCTVTLLSDSAATPTTERCRVEATSGVGITVTIALTTSNTATLSYLVPAGDRVRLVSNVVGTGVATLVSQNEVTLG